MKIEKTDQYMEIDALFESGSRQEIIVACMNFETKLFYFEIGGYVLTPKYCKDIYGRLDPMKSTEGCRWMFLSRAVRVLVKSVWIQWKMQNGAYIVLGDDISRKFHESLISF